MTSRQSWADGMLENLRAFCKFQREARGIYHFRFEEFRAVAIVSNWPEPVNSHAWGSLPAMAVERGIIRATGRYERAKSAASRGSMVSVWEIV